MRPPDLGECRVLLFSSGSNRRCSIRRPDNLSSLRNLLLASGALLSLRNHCSSLPTPLLHIYVVLEEELPRKILFFFKLQLLSDFFVFLDLKLHLINIRFFLFFLEGSVLQLFILHILCIAEDRGGSRYTIV